MKNSLLGLITIVLFSLNVKGQESDFIKKSKFASGSLITLFNTEKIEYKFKSLDELDKGMDEIVKEFNFNDSEKDKDLIIEIKIETIVGFETIFLSESIKTRCANELALQALKKLKMLLSATGG